MIWDFLSQWGVWKKTEESLAWKKREDYQLSGEERNERKMPEGRMSRRLRGEREGGREEREWSILTSRKHLKERSRGERTGGIE